MNAKKDEFIVVLLEARKLLERRDNDFAWSSWKDRTDALTEMNSHIEKVKNADYSTLANIQLLFAPTGDIQEVSLSSGWAQQFLDLSAQFDEALISLQHQIKR